MIRFRPQPEQTTGGTIRFGSKFNLPGSFDLISSDETTIFHYEEAVGRQFEGLCYEAAEVARCISEDMLEAPCRPLQSTLDTMQTLDLIRSSVGIKFV